MMIQRSFIFSLNCYGYFGAAKNVWIEWWMMEMESGKRRRGRGVISSPSHQQRSARTSSRVVHTLRLLLYKIIYAAFSASRSSLNFFINSS